MVKHGRTKKRRAGRTGKTKLKHNSHRLFRKAKIQDPVIKANWDRRKSPTVNMQHLGLRDATSMNHTTELYKAMGGAAAVGETQTSGESGTCKAVELYDVPASDIIPKKTLAQRMLPVSIENQEYIVKLLEKYGDDYGKMARDIKMNNMQHTENKLRKIGARFLLLNEKEIRVDIPENIKSLMACF